MGLLDKIKNTFFEEEYVEVEEKPKKVKHVKEEVKKQEKPVYVETLDDDIEELEPVEEDEDDETEELEPIVEEQSKVSSTREEKFSYFDEDDFLDYEAPVETVKEEPKAYSNAYGGAKVYSQSSNLYSKKTIYPKENSGSFTPTPIISPIYGVLDKNYKKEELVEKKEIKPSSSYVSRKNVDLDSIRAKAYGTKKEDFHEEEEIEENYEEEIKPVIEEDNLLYDMTDIDKTPSVEKVTIQDAEEYYEDLGLEYNIDYKDVKTEKAKGRRVSKPQPIEDFEEEDIMPEDVIENSDPENDLSIEDNLFDLIDSMYEERDN